MKMLKKTLAMFMAVLTLMSCMSVSFYAAAAEINSDANYEALAYSFFSYHVENQGFVSKKVIDRDANGNPIKSIVGDLTHYSISNASDDYEYADEHENPIRAVSFEHKVTAKDNSKSAIRAAALDYLAIVDSLISYDYGVGLYTIPMIQKEVVEKLKFVTDADGNYLFLDGYTYLVDSVGKIKFRSPAPTYDVIDGEIVEREGEDKDKWLDDIENVDSYYKMSLFDFCQVSSIIAYFSGNCTSVNSGNWFHSYTFECVTDIETVLTTEPLENRPLTIQTLTVDWELDRSYDDSGTQAQYFNKGYTVDKGNNTTDYTRQELVALQGSLDNYFATYYYPGVLEKATNDALLLSYYPDIIQQLDTFQSISNAAKIAVFGQSAYSYINLVTQLTPMIDPGTPTDASYWPKHTYYKYEDSNGNPIVYQVDATKVTTIVSTIDDLLNSERVGAILSQFFNFTDPENQDKAYYYDALNAKTAQDYLKVFIADFLFNDDIINTIMGALYPMVTNLLDENLTNNMIQGALSGLGGFVTDLIEWVVECDDGWQGLVYGVLIGSPHIALTPAGVAYVWKEHKYMQTSDANFNVMMQNNHDILKAAEGGTMDASSNGWYKTPGYMSIGVEGDKYWMNRWGAVDFDLLHWNVNGDRTKFLSALDAILAPIAPLLGVILGNQKMELKVGQLAFDVIAYLQDLDLYADVILPLFEALEIPNLCPPAEFRRLAGVINGSASRTKETIEDFLNNGLLNPLINWALDVLLDDPIGTILKILPNLSYYLTSGAVLASIKSVKIPIGLKFAVDYGAVYTLDLGDLLGDAIDFLTSLQGVLDLIGIGVDTGVPIVGYHKEGDTLVFRPDEEGYTSDHNIPVTEAYISVDGLKSTTPNTEFATHITGLDENGNYTEYVVRDDVGWRNNAGVVVTDRNDGEATPEEYYIPVKIYYEYTVVVDEEAGESITYKVAETSMIPSEIFQAGKYSTIQSVVNMQAEAKLPAIMDYKLQGTGTLETTTSLRDNNFTMTNANDEPETWNAYTRKHIKLEVGGMETGGLVLLFLFRYIFSALMYRNYDANMMDFTSDYTLLDAFGLDDDMLTKELFAGLRLQDIIDNVCLSPDGAIAALYELFYKNEFGSIYELVNGVVQTNTTPYSYPLEYVDYHTDVILGYAQEHDDYNYGTSVLYNEYWTKEKASYIVDNLDDIVDNVFKMLKLENMDTIGQYLENLIGDMLFTNDMISTIASTLYGLLSNITDAVDIPGILDAALDVDLSKTALMESLVYEFGEDIKLNGSVVVENEDGTTSTKVVTSVYNKLLTEEAVVAQLERDALNAAADEDFELYHSLQDQIKTAKGYSDSSFYQMGIDEETGEDVKISSFDWGYNNAAITSKYSDTEIFVRALSAVASPFSFLIKFLFAGDDLSLLNLIHIPGYEGYYYAWIPLLETLGATDGLVDFQTYFTKLFAGESTIAMNCDTIYYTVKPLFAFVERVLENPVEVVLNLVPNLLFFITLGGLNDMLNNLIHFAYVLLDILGPVFDAYPLLDNLLSNLNIGGMTLNLAVPLDFDFNQLINQLLEGVLGENLSFDIENKNIVLGQELVEKEVFTPTLDENGNEQLDEEGNVIGTTEMKWLPEDIYAVGTLKIKLPYIDFSTLCAGTVEEKMSVSGKRILGLNSGGGADLITLVFRIVSDTLFFEDNAVNIANFLIGFCQLDDENGSDELLMEIFLYLNNSAHEAHMPDQVLNIIYTIYKLLVPVADQLGTRFGNVDFSITDLFDGISDTDLTMQRIEALLGAGEGDNPTLSGFGRLIELLKQFFAKLKAFFEGLFNRD